MHTAMTWQWKPIRTQVYDVQRDGYLLILEDGTFTFLDRHLLAELRGGFTPYRPQPLVTLTPSPPPKPLPVPLRVQRRTRVINDCGWGGGHTRPRSRRYLTTRTA